MTKANDQLKAILKAHGKPRKVKIPRLPSEGEERLAAQLKEAGLPFEREYRFAPPRRWKFDFAIVDHKIAVEVEGGIYSMGRHTRPQGYIADLEKYNTATMLGWRLLRYTTEQIRTLNPCLEIIGLAAILSNSNPLSSDFRLSPPVHS